jgi:carbonic anhydrase
MIGNASRLIACLVPILLVVSIFPCASTAKNEFDAEEAGEDSTQILKKKEGTIMSAIDRVLEANRKYGDEFNQGGLPGRPPASKLAVVTCMDCRLHVSKLLGLELGDAHIIRNAGGVVTEDVLRSLIISYHIGGTREFMVVSNTKCGMLTFKDEDLADRLKRGTGKAPLVPARFLAFTDLEENVREQILKIRSHPWIPDSVTVRGFIYDVDTGRLSEVSP